MPYIVITGDKHTRHKRPYYDSILKVMDWFVDSEWNHEDNIYVSLGDETEESINKGEINSIILNFYKSLKMKKKYVLKGNHDYKNENGSNLEMLSIFPEVEVINEWQEINLEGIECLFLPYFYSLPNGDTMEDIYSSLRLDKEFDYAFGHIMDETKQFSKTSKICDLSNLKIKKRVFGHDHKFGGNYLGSMHPNSKTEINKKPHIYVIDIETGEGKAVEIPLYLNYYDVAYPDKLPEFKEDYIMLRITEAIDVEKTIEYYTKLMKDQGKDFYRISINRKRLIERQVEGDKISDDLTDGQFYDKFETDNKIDDSVSGIIRPLLKRI